MSISDLERQAAVYDDIGKFIQSFNHQSRYKTCYFESTFDSNRIWENTVFTNTQSVNTWNSLSHWVVSANNMLTYSVEYNMILRFNWTESEVVVKHKL